MQNPLFAMHNIKIRPLVLSDLDRLSGLQPEGWVPLEGMFRFFHRQFFCFPFVAELDGKIVGTANGIQNRKSAWLSHITVADSFQRQGIGSYMTEFILNYMLKKGSRTILLVATTMGERIYQRMGFYYTGSYDFYRGAVSQPVNLAANIHEAKSVDLKAIVSLDRKMSGEIRSDMIKLHLKNALVYKRAFPRHIQGFYLPTLGEGMIVASNACIGIQLLKAHLSHNPDKIVIPSNNHLASDYLISLGFEKIRTATRMCYGKNVKWRSNMLFSRVGGWYG